MLIEKKKTNKEKENIYTRKNYYKNNKNLYFHYYPYSVVKKHGLKNFNDIWCMNTIRSLKLYESGVFNWQNYFIDRMIFYSFVHNDWRIAYVILFER